MSEFLRDLLIASSACAVIGLLSDSLEGGLSRSLSLVCSLVLLFYLISPIVGAINDYENNMNDDLTSFLPDIPATEIRDGTQSNNIIFKESEKLLITREKERIQKKYSLSEDDFSLDIKLKSNGESTEIDTLTLTVRSLKALAYEKDISYELESNYLCECLIIEDI